jgi:hypothetical protein
VTNHQIDLPDSHFTSHCIMQSFIHSSVNCCIFSVIKYLHWFSLSKTIMQYLLINHYTCWLNYLTTKNIPIMSCTIVLGDADMEKNVPYIELLIFQYMKIMCFTIS